MSKFLIENINRKLLIFFLVISGTVLFLVIKIFSTEDQTVVQTTVQKPAWQRKLNTSQALPLKIGIITDTHIKTDEISGGERKLEPDYQNVFDDFVTGMKSFNPDFVVHLGDIIQEKG
jgi:hypothetical protein